MKPKIGTMVLMEAEYVTTLKDHLTGDMYARYDVTTPIEDDVPFGLVLAPNGLHTWGQTARDCFGIAIAILPEGDPPKKVSIHLKFDG